MIGIFSPLYFLVRSLRGGHKNGPGSFMEQGYDHKKAGSFSKAEQAYTHAIESGTSTWVAYFYRGECRLGQKNYCGAIADFEKAIEINPKYSVKAKEALERARRAMQG